MADPIALSPEEVANLKALDAEFSRLDIEYGRMAKIGMDVTAQRAQLDELRKRRDALLNEYGPTGAEKAKRQINMIPAN